MKDYLTIHVNKKTLTNFFITFFWVMIGMGIGYVILEGSQWAYNSIQQSDNQETFDRGYYVAVNEIINLTNNGHDWIKVENQTGYSVTLYTQSCLDENKFNFGTDLFRLGSLDFTDMGGLKLRHSDDMGTSEGKQ